MLSSSCCDFKVQSMGDTKDKIKRIYEALPQLNCGQCGFEGCGQFAKAVAEGRASPFGCRQNPWIGYEISDIIGLRTPFTGYPNRFYQSSLMSRSGVSPSLESLGKEVRELSKRMESILDRIDALMKRGDESSVPPDKRRKASRAYPKTKHPRQTKTRKKGGD
jgi:Na+-translocating ferredoxin:NAD+ oxidoreductase RNF subunit RnfB